jgi:Tol biopolymer transport system component
VASSSFQAGTLCILDDDRLKVLTIFVMNRNGRQQTMLTDDSNAVDDEHPVWSPNGRKIAFARLQGGDYDIWVMNPDGSRQRNLTNNASPVDDFEPYWQPIVP